MIQTCGIYNHWAVDSGLSPTPCPYPPPGCSLLCPPSAQPLSCICQCPRLPDPFTIVGTELKDERYSDADEYISLHSQWVPEVA